MCKLNLLCQQNDGDCNCNQSNSKLVPGNKAQNGLLCAILSYIKSQPEIIKSLTESSNEEKTEDSVQSSSSVQRLDQVGLSPTLSSSQEGVAEYSVNVISDLPSKFTAGRGFALLVEVLDKSCQRLSAEDQLTYQAMLLDRVTGEELQTLGEVTTNGVALFRKLVIDSRFKAGSLVVRVSGRPDITHFSYDICIRCKKAGSESKRRHQSTA